MAAELLLEADGLACHAACGRAQASRHTAHGSTRIVSWTGSMVEFRNSISSSIIEHRETEELLNDLCVALREVAVWERSLPTGERARESVQNAVDIARELEKRNASFDSRLEELSKETGWMMRQLLEECRQFPGVVPTVRDSDGVRRQLRCSYCKVRERRETELKYWACDACFQLFIQSFESLVPIKGTVLFRTYNANWRCKHADENTIVLGRDHFEDGIHGPGECKQCLEAQLAALQERLGAS